MKKLLREPLLHFLALGAALFAMNAWREQQRPPANAAPRIEINAAVVERLRAGHERQIGRSPDADELRGLVDAHIREEVLYREALALGLDRDDTIVRRRMAQKMEFLTNDVVGAAAPNDAALQRFFEQHRERYAKPARVTFRHVYFSKEKRGASLEKVTLGARDELAKEGREDALGDAFLHGFEFADQEPADIEALFGQDFSKRISTLREGEWSDPLVSSYGLHLVIVERRSGGGSATLAEMRDTVARDLSDEKRRAANQEVFEKLCGRYRIAVDEEALTKAAAPKAKTAQR